MTTRLTPEREQEIRERCERQQTDGLHLDEAAAVFAEDVPALLAELDATRRERDEAVARASNPLRQIAGALPVDAGAEARADRAFAGLYTQHSSKPLPVKP